MPLPGLWEFPGGKLEENESEEECIVRELKEELNCETRIIKKLPVSDYCQESIIIRLIPFILKINSGEPVATEHEEIKWLNLNEIKPDEWAPADVPILNSLKSEFKNLNLYE